MKVAVEYRIYPVNENKQEYFNQVKQLQVEVEQAKAAPYLYQGGDDFVADVLGLAHVKVLAFDGEKLVGFAVLRLMSEWPDYLAFIEQPDELSAMILYVLVHPEWRGKGIGRQLGLLRVEQAKALKVRHLYATTHPQNTITINNLRRLGMSVIAERKMFTEQLLRYLMYRQL